MFGYTYVCYLFFFDKMDYLTFFLNVAYRTFVS